MRSSFSRLSRIIDRDTRHWLPQSWKYVEKNIKHATWFWCRNPLRVAHDLWWWARHRTTNRYHILKLGLKPGWWDVDTRLLYASFTLLESYVENEKPFKLIEWNDTDDSREHANEIHSLYMWWKWRKNADLEYEDLAEENERYNEETENLIRLMKIRMTLWT